MTTRKNFWVASLALGFALSCPQVTPILSAQSAAPDAQQQQQPQDQQKSETFVGKIVKAKNGQFALLTDAQTGKGFYLDDQEKAKPFEGKTVKVTGTVEAARNMVHVTDIQQA